MPKLNIGFTGPSLFISQVQKMIEDEFQATPIYICQDKQDDLEFVLKDLDAVILSGGKDICPTSYGEEITNFNGLSSFDEDRDLREFFVIDYCLSKNIPILGICRGHQMMAIFHGISLIQNISNSQVCHNPISAKITINGPVHYLKVAEEYKKEFFDYELVSSYHHQAVPYFLSQNEIIPIGYAITDYGETESKHERITEIMKGKSKKWLSVQFHPETDYTTNKASKVILDKFKEMI